MNLKLFLENYPVLCETQDFRYFHINCYQEYLFKYISNIIKKCKICPHKNIKEDLQKYLLISNNVWNNSISLCKLFDTMHICYKTSIVNKYLITIRDNLIIDKPIPILSIYFIQKILHFNKYICLNCQSCLDFKFNIDLVIQLLKKEIDIESAKKMVYTYTQLSYIDEMLDCEYLLPMPEFNIMGLYQRNKNKLVYLDSNVIMDIENDSTFNKLLLRNIKNNQDYDYYYSPSHLEDIAKRRGSKDSLFEIIEKITNNIFIHRKNDSVNFVYESPRSSYKRVNNSNSLEISKLVENYHIELIKNINLFCKDYDTDAHKININNKDLIGKDANLLDTALELISAGFMLNDIKNIDIKSIKYIELNNIIYKLFMALDVLYYRHEPIDNKKKLRSSVHDVEHIIYASYGDIFVTNDKRLYHRSKVVFYYINPNIKIFNATEFNSFIGS